MTEAKPSYMILLQRLVTGSSVWYTSIHVLQHSRPLTCTLISGQVIGGSLDVYRPILEKGGAEVFFYMIEMVAGLVAETDKN